MIVVGRTINAALMVAAVMSTVQAAMTEMHQDHGADEDDPYPVGAQETHLCLLRFDRFDAGPMIGRRRLPRIVAGYGSSLRQVTNIGQPRAAPLGITRLIQP